ncbi:MAG: hypothetical protein R3C61_12770 [Bacteroidia bacterium]
MGYKRIVIAGFSLGGNVLLKYLGEKAHLFPAEITHVPSLFPFPATLLPVRQTGPPEKLYLPAAVYDQTEKKVRQKPSMMKLAGDPEKLKNFRMFDNAITAPIHGFADADDYYTQSSCKQFIPGIRIPTLLVNAQNDPFLTPACFPEEEARNSRYFYMETPHDGGHVGFYTPGKANIYWSELRALHFTEETMS